MVQQRSDLGAVGARWGRKHVRGTVVIQRGGALRVGRQWKRHRRVLVVGVEAQPFPSVTHIVCESRTEGVRGTRGAVVVVRTRVQLIQRNRADSCAVHGEGVAGVAGKVRERVRSRHRAHVHLRIILLTAVILRRRERGERGSFILLFSFAKNNLSFCELVLFTSLLRVLLEDCDNSHICNIQSWGEEAISPAKNMNCKQRKLCSSALFKEKRCF